MFSAIKLNKNKIQPGKQGIHSGGRNRVWEAIAKGELLQEVGKVFLALLHAVSLQLNFSFTLRVDLHAREQLAGLHNKQ